MPTLTQLQYVITLHRVGHFGRAAAECGVSQPTLSAAIAKVERELDTALFDRRSKPIAATEPGLHLIALARQVLDAHEQLMAAAGGAEAVSGSFTLGVIPTIGPYVLPWFLEPFANAYPHVRLTVVERTTQSILQGLQNTELDAGLLATPLGEEGFDTTVLFYDPFYVYCHQASPLLQQGEVEVADIEAADLWLLEDGHCFRTQVVHLCGLNQRTLLQNVRFEAGSFATLRGLIDHVGGCTLVPESYARTLPRDTRLSRLRPFRSRTPTRQVSLLTQRRQWKSAITDAIAAVLRERAPRSLPRELGEGEVLPVLV